MSDLQKLSYAASGGPWSVEALPHRIDIDGGNGGWLFRVGVGDDFTTEMHPGDYNATLADADFVVALVNAYRSGALVSVGGSATPADQGEKL